MFRELKEFQGRSMEFRRSSRDVTRGFPERFSSLKGLKSVLGLF